MSLSAYVRLMRFNKPIGTLLLWMPTAWALWIANKGMPDILLLVYFLAGTILMRAAGCIINDIADIEIDKHVSRTKYRPLTSGELSLNHAVLLFIVVLFLSLLVVLQLPLACLIYAFFALGVTILYPFCKRFFQAPQLVLGVAFSMGIPMAFTASYIPNNSVTWLLVIINILWVISYDTMYAMVDRTDDLKIGVKSTAVLLADWDRCAIFFMQTILHSLWLFVAKTLPMNGLFYMNWAIGALILGYQQFLVNTRKEGPCFKAFLFNAWYGAVMWLGIIAGLSF